jgi:predicted phosphoribosyltransferase
MLAAIEAVGALEPAQIVVAVPVADRDTCDAVRPEADQLVCLVTPPELGSVGSWYDDFSPTTDTEVRGLLDLARINRWPGTPAPRLQEERAAKGRPHARRS